MKKRMDNVGVSKLCIPRPGPFRILKEKVGASALLRREPRIKLPGSELNSTVCEYFENALKIASEDIKISNLRHELLEEFREDLKKLEKFGRSRVIPLFIVDSAILDTILEETECINEIKVLKEKMSRHIKKGRENAQNSK